MLRLATDVLREKATEAGHETQEDIAGHAGIDRSALSRLMAGRTTPTLATVRRLAMAYDVPMDDLVIERVPAKATGAPKVHGCPEPVQRVPA